MLESEKAQVAQKQVEQSLVKDGTKMCLTHLKSILVVFLAARAHTSINEADCAWTAKRDQQHAQAQRFRTSL